MSEKTRDDLVAANLAAVEEHFHYENPDGIERAVALYTDDIVWEVPSRHRLQTNRDVVEQEYREIFASAEGMERQLLERFATEDRVVTDEILHFRVTGDGFKECPFPVGTNVEMRLVHIFHMRDGKIARENAYEIWHEVGD